jgi:hypothetical protein
LHKSLSTERKLLLDLVTYHRLDPDDLMAASASLRPQDARRLVREADQRNSVACARLLDALFGEGQGR